MLNCYSYLALPVMMVALVCCDQAALNPAPPTVTTMPAEWKRIEAEGRFAFSVPPEFEMDIVQGIDSIVGRYTSSTMELSFDYGWYSDPLSGMEKSGVQRQQTQIGGRVAFLVSYDQPNEFPFVTAVHFPSVGNGRNALTMRTVGKTPNDRTMAIRIFESIEFWNKKRDGTENGTEGE